MAGLLTEPLRRPKVSQRCTSPAATESQGKNPADPNLSPPNPEPPAPNSPAPPLPPSHRIDFINITQEMLMKPIAVLLIEHDPLEAQAIEGMLRASDLVPFAVERAGCLDDALAHLRRPGQDAAILDCALPGATGTEHFRAVQQTAPAVPVIVLARPDDTCRGSQAVQEGPMPTWSNPTSTAKPSFAICTTPCGSGGRRLKNSVLPCYHLAQQQFLQASQIMGLDDNVRERLLYPRRPRWSSALPFRRDDYQHVENVFGYRVQHSSDQGPSKGGIRYHPERRPRRGVGPGHVDVLEMRRDEHALRRRQRRRACRPQRPVAGELDGSPGATPWRSCT